jgi:hypothetical protein
MLLLDSRIRPPSASLIIYAHNLGPCKGSNTCLLIQLACEDLVTVKGGINAIEWLVPYVHESEVYKRLIPL